MKERFDLIRGSFTPSEAADVLLSLLNYKIKFHSIKRLNLQDHEQDIRASEERLLELTKFKQLVEQSVISAHHNFMEIKINGTIEIELVEPKTEKLELDLGTSNSKNS